MTAELEIIGSNRILAGTRADIQVRCYRDGVLATPTGTLTFSAADADGTVVASGTPTAADGVLTAVLTAAQNADVNTLTVTWGGLVFSAEPAISLTTEHESVGAWLFTLADIRGFGDNEQLLSSVTKYTDAFLLQERDRVTDQLGERLKYPLGARYERQTVDGDGTAELFLLGAWRCREVRAISIRAYGASTWTALTAGELALVFITKHGILAREGNIWPRGRQNIRVAFENGVQPIPLELKQAGLAVLVDSVIGSDTPDRAITQTNENGTFNLATPGMRGSFVGIPGVDEAIEHHRVKTLGIA